MYVSTACLGRGHTETSHFGLVIACAQLACVLPVERSHQTPSAKLEWLVFCPPNFEYLETHQRSQEIRKQNSGDLQVVFSFDEEVEIKNNKKQRKPGS